MSNSSSFRGRYVRDSIKFGFDTRLASATGKNGVLLPAMAYRARLVSLGYANVNVFNVGKSGGWATASVEKDGATQILRIKRNVDGRWDVEIVPRIEAIRLRVGYLKAMKMNVDLETTKEAEGKALKEKWRREK